MDPASTFPITLSFRVATIAILITAPLGVALAWTQARAHYRLRGAVDTMILLPLILPPSVVGYFLVVLFGRQGAVGSWLAQELGVRIVFTPVAAIMASCVVALPIIVKTAQPAIESVQADLEDVARTLGLRPVTVFFRVTLPAAWRGVAAAVILGFARAVGEFGATLMFAGNIPGRTNTMPLEIFSAYQTGDDARAIMYVVVLSVISVLVVLLASQLTPRGSLAR